MPFLKPPLWLRRMLSRPPPSRADAPDGFPDAPELVRAANEGLLARPVAPEPPVDAHPGWQAPERPDAPAFPTTGPQGHRERMRARVLAHGPRTLAEYELLEVLLFGVFRTGDTKPLAKSLINRFGSLAGVLAAPQAELMACRGIGPHTVAMIRIIQESALCLIRGQVSDKPVLNNWERLMDYLTANMARETVEHFHILFLDPRNRLIADEAQARGTVNHAPVYPREVVKRALDLHATAIILVHNHPSGDPTPSEADIQMTDDIACALHPVGVVLHDHVIVGKGRWTSFRRQGLLGA